MKIREYKTAVANNIQALDKKVNTLIGEGWQPFGTQYFIGNTEGNADCPICQPMVKYEPKND
jgi:hypothetical protein